MDRKAVEEMVRHHVLAFYDRSKIVGTVPPLEFVEEGQQPRRILFRHDDTQAGSVPDEALNQTHARLRYYEFGQ